MPNTTRQQTANAIVTSRMILMLLRYEFPTLPKRTPSNPQEPPANPQEPNKEPKQ